MQTCFICLGVFAQTHAHHIFPQAYSLDPNEVDERTVPLCGTCHTALHSQQVALAAKDPERRKQRYFPPDQMARAQDLLDAINLAKLRWENAGKPGAQTVQLKLDRPTVTALHLKKGDYGYTNLADFAADIIRQWLVERMT